jgi:hypothetical protein
VGSVERAQSAGGGICREQAKKAKNKNVFGFSAVKKFGECGTVKTPHPRRGMRSKAGRKQWRLLNIMILKI